MARGNQISHGDSYSQGQLAQAWGRSTFFVQQMIKQGKLQVDERGLVTNDALRNFYAAHGTELD
jgi:hypothetical protein